MSDQSATQSFANPYRPFPIFFFPYRPRWDMTTNSPHPLGGWGVWVVPGGEGVRWGSPRGTLYPLGGVRGGRFARWSSSVFSLHPAPTAGGETTSWFAQDPYILVRYPLYPWAFTLSFRDGCLQAHPRVYFEWWELSLPLGLYLPPTPKTRTWPTTCPRTGSPPPDPSPLAGSRQGDKGSGITNLGSLRLPRGDEKFGDLIKSCGLFPFWP